jgi:hypothetical protein
MDEGGSNIVTELLSALWAVWKEMFDVVVEIAPKAISFILWVLCGFIILPCMFIAGELSGKWIEWGEGM